MAKNRTSDPEGSGTISGAWASSDELIQNSRSGWKLFGENLNSRSYGKTVRGEFAPIRQFNASKKLRR